MSTASFYRALVRANPATNLGLRTARSQPSLLGTLSTVQHHRFISTKTSKLTPEDAANLLNAQRKLRPSSPHFTIYQPQLTWLSSIANRVTGCALSGGLYAFAISYLVLPATGVTMDSETIVQFVASGPEWSKVAAKAIVALPFTYHTFNGFRHLGWDMGYFLELKSSYTAGYAVLGLTAVSTVGLALM